MELSGMSLWRVALIALAAFLLWRAVAPRLRAVRSVLRAQAEPERAWAPKGPLWRWARGAWSLWLGGIEEHLITPELARQMLEDLGVGDEGAVRDLIREIDETGAERATWSDVRAIAIARLAFASGLWLEPEAGGVTRERALRLRGRHDGWEPLGDAFVREHEDVLGEGSSSTSAFDAPRRGRTVPGNTIRENRRDAAPRAWGEVDFDADLEGGWNDDAGGAAKEKPRRRRRRRAGSGGEGR